MLGAGFLRAEQQLGPVKVNCEVLGADPSGDFFEKFEAAQVDREWKGHLSVVSAIGGIRGRGDGAEGCDTVRVEGLTLDAPSNPPPPPRSHHEHHQNVSKLKVSPGSPPKQQNKQNNSKEKVEK